MELRTPDKLKRYKPKDNRIEEISELKKLILILNQLNIKWWIDFGALLGAYRKNKIIQYDQDIDITCLITDDINTNSYILLTTLQDTFYITHYIENGYISLVPKNENFNLNAIDIHYCKEVNKHIEYTIFPNLKIRSFFFNNLNKIILEGEEFNCPQHLATYLNIRYGDDFLKEIPGISYTKNIGLVKDNYSIYVPVVADLFHIGHLNLFKKCKSLFDTVVVGIHNDEAVSSYKLPPIIPYEQRIELVKACKYVDVVYENAEPIITDEIVDKIGVDFVGVGREDEDKINKLYPMNKERLHFFERTDGVSSTLIKQKIIKSA